MPELDPHHQWVWQAFEVLSSRRIESESGPQPIQVSEIAAYVEYVGVADEADKEDLLFLIVKLDSLMCDYIKTERARARKKAEAQAAAKVKRGKGRRR